MKIEYGYYAVAFIDVLGQKESFNGLEEFPEEDVNGEFREKLLNAHINSVKFVEDFREVFDSFFKVYTQGGKSKDKLPEAVQETYMQLSKCGLKYFSFSDFIQAYTSLRTDKYHSQAINGIYGMLMACGEMMIITLSKGKAFRAGIDVGIATETASGEIYGPALFKAYNLESEIAQYPRVIVGPTLIDYLKEVVSGKPSVPDQPSADIIHCKSIAKKCLDMIVIDVDGHFKLDYLGNEFRQLENGLAEEMKLEAKKVLAQAFNFVETEWKKWKSLKNQKLASRYFQLYNYFKSRGF